MAEDVIQDAQADTDLGDSRIYEVGYLIVPSVDESAVEKIVAEIRGPIEKTGGSFIAEGAPSLIRLAYEMTAREGDKNVVYDRGYYGWLKFETSTETAQALEVSLNADAKILRHIIFRTVREDTRAKMKAPTLREVKTPHTARTAPRREEETSVPVSEVDLDKALETITTE
jgi:ribosomal protein S6